MVILDKRVKPKWTQSNERSKRTQRTEHEIFVPCLWILVYIL